jgi:hypothetical protein
MYPLKIINSIYDLLMLHLLIIKLSNHTQVICSCFSVEWHIDNVLFIEISNFQFIIVIQGHALTSETKASIDLYLST